MTGRRTGGGRRRQGITRRDFLNGTQVAIGASLLPGLASASEAGTADNPFRLDASYYPPERTGLRGSHDGSWETMHGLTGGQRWPSAEPGDRYDLVVVGAGISGLAAAHFYRQARPDARILVLDNHDDFGGHAKRNEFQVGDRTRIGYGGTESIDTPSAYSDAAKQLLVDIGIDTERFYEYFDQKLYRSMGLAKSILFDAQSFAAEKLVVGYNQKPWEAFAAEAPMSDRARADLVRLWTDTRDYLPGRTREEKYEILRKVSYWDFLEHYAKVDRQVLEIFRRWGMSFWCVGIDEVPAPAVQSYDGGMPGLSHTLPRVGTRGDEPYIFHFPDGNASVARLLVRRLIPEAMPGSTMEDVVVARAHYPALDRPGAEVAIRLNSTVVNVSHQGARRGVGVTYVHRAPGGGPGTVHQVRADRCIMACYNSAIPYLCPELPEVQRQGLAYNVKVPLTYTKVAVPDWRAFAELGTDFVYYTNGFFKQVELDYPVSIGSYRFGSSPEEPMVLHMCHVHYAADLKGPEQWREGRRRLLTTPFAEFEHQVRHQLDQALASTGFDAERDIRAITVNRWAHGYAYSPGLLWEPDWPDEASKPWVKGRQPFGQIAIANSDAGASATTNSAITQAYRAVQEILRA